MPERRDGADHGTEEGKDRAKAAGFDHHLVKPVDLGALEDVLGGFGKPRGTTTLH